MKSIKLYISKNYYMFWIILSTTLVYIIANFSLFFSLRYVHKVDGVIGLWGFAPNQFLWLTIFFPLATFCTLFALHSFTFRLNPILPSDFPLKSFFDHWPVSILIGFIISSIISIIVYFSSAWSFDKLQPQYAQLAIKSYELVEDQIVKSSLKKEEQEQFRHVIIKNAKLEAESLQLPNKYDITTIENWMKTLKPEVLLQVVQSPILQIKLKLLNPILHALNVFQLFCVIFIAFCSLSISIACIITARDINYDGKNFPELTQTINSVFYSIFFYGFYSICYNQYRQQIEAVVGVGTTILQDIFVGVLVAVLLIWLKSLDPTNRDISSETLIKFLPVVIVGSGTVIGIISPQVMKQLIGNETKTGIQIILTIITLFFSLIPISQIITRR